MQAFFVMCYSAYIIFSDSINRYYIGHIQNLANRISEQNSGETTSIKNGIPWRLVWSKEFSTRAEAMKSEKQIKSRGASRFLAEQS